MFPNIKTFIPFLTLNMLKHKKSSKPFQLKLALLNSSFIVQYSILFQLKIPARIIPSNFSIHSSPSSQFQNYPIDEI